VRTAVQIRPPRFWIAAAAKKLVQTDHVLGIVGSTSILECTIDHAYWESLGYYEIDFSDLTELREMVHGRLYHRRAHINGQQHYRDRILQTESEYQFHPVIKRYQDALRRRDTDAFLATFPRRRVLRWPRPGVRPPRGQRHGPVTRARTSCGKASDR
jgi:hypothetical protein